MIKVTGKIATSLFCVAVCFFTTGCAIVESYYRPLGGQGVISSGGNTWNRPDNLAVDIQSNGKWLIIQRLDGWENLLHVQLSLWTNSKNILVPDSNEVVIIANEEKYMYKLVKSSYAPQIPWECKIDIDFGKKLIQEFTLLVPDMLIDGKIIATKPLRFKRVKGLVFYMLL